MFHFHPGRSLTSLPWTREFGALLIIKIFES